MFTESRSRSGEMGASAVHWPLRTLPKKEPTAYMESPNPIAATST